MLVVVGLLKYNSPSFMDQVTGELMVITTFFILNEYLQFLRKLLQQW